MTSFRYFSSITVGAVLRKDYREENDQDDLDQGSITRGHKAKLVIYF